MFFKKKISNFKREKFYFDRGMKVKRGSKLDKSIQQYQKKGYYTTDIGSGHYSEWRKDPPTLRPALTGGTFHQRNYHHPLESSERKQFSGAE